MEASQSELGGQGVLTQEDLGRGHDLAISLLMLLSGREGLLSYGIPRQTVEFFQFPEDTVAVIPNQPLFRKILPWPVGAPIGDRESTDMFYVRNLSFRPDAEGKPEIVIHTQIDQNRHYEEVRLSRDDISQERASLAVCADPAN